MKIAIIGAGLAGLACARECERLGIVAEVFERDSFSGWVWPSVSVWLNALEPKMKGDIRQHLREEYHLDIKPLFKCGTMIMKSPGKKFQVKGHLGYFVSRGAIDGNSIENQLLKDLKKTAIHFNSPADYKELMKKYDYVVVANGKVEPAKEMGLWEQYGTVLIRGAVAVGNFEQDSATLYLNTLYAGQGFARLTPFSPTHAILGLNYIGPEQFQMDRFFTEFIAREGLEHLEIICKMDAPVFATGRVKRFRQGNVLLAGCAAGLTDRLIGTGGIQAMITGVLAARSIIKEMDYDNLVKLFQEHIENISSFRKPVEELDNRGYDELLTFLGAPGIKQTIYKSRLNLVDTVGCLIKRFNQP